NRFLKGRSLASSTPPSIASPPMPELTDEFGWIASLRALTLGDERALRLADDAAVLPARPGYDLVISKDAMVEGVHFPLDEAPDVVARRLLRTGLSDLAAKAATPFGYFLMTAWPADRDASYRTAFRQGLELDGREFGAALLGGDTVSTPGPLTLSATVLGWVEAGRAVLRSGATAGDALMVCGDIGDGWLGLLSTQGKVDDPSGRLARHYRLPTPLLALREVLLRHVHAAADVSDGLIADAGHIAEASGLGLDIDLDALPISPGARAWWGFQTDPTAARLALATGGDDYALVCAVSDEQQSAFSAAVESLAIPVAKLGVFSGRPGIRTFVGGRRIEPKRTGWRHSDHPDPPD
ncbi:MAG TPA: thiamine-phosphate kinase, partial [Caulobacteraceae bacterium]